MRHSRPGGADMILLSQFLQYIPLRSLDEHRYNRVEMVTAVRDLTRPGGRLFIIEEVFGENAEEHLTFAVNWDKAIATRVRANLERVGQVLSNIDPSLVDLLRTKRDHRALAGLMRERAHRQGDRQVVPLSVWYRTFEHPGATLSRNPARRSPQLLPVRDRALEPLGRRALDHC